MQLVAESALLILDIKKPNMMNEAIWGKSSSKEEKNSINSGKVSHN